VSFEVGPDMPRPAAPHQPGSYRPGVTPPPREPRDKPDAWYARYILFPLFVLVLVGGVAAWECRYVILRSMATPDESGWRTVTATVTRTSVESTGAYELADTRYHYRYRYRDPDRYRSTGYVPEVDFTFTVDGKSYSGSNLGCLPRVYDSESSAQRTLEGYPGKTPIVVRYDPRDPGQNVVDPGCRELVGTATDSLRW
jgi:hypothetical protein